jgi:hypothetical protein
MQDPVPSTLRPFSSLVLPSKRKDGIDKAVSATEATRPTAISYYASALRQAKHDVSMHTATTKSGHWKTELGICSHPNGPAEILQ